MGGSGRFHPAPFDGLFDRKEGVLTPNLAAVGATEAARSAKGVW